MVCLADCSIRCPVLEEPKVLKMEDFELIRRMVQIDGLSIREVARRLNKSRNSVTKALENASPTPYSNTTPRSRPKTDQFLPFIRTWLEQDRAAPRKQRHSAVRVFERLQVEYGFTGSRRVISDVVKIVRREMSQPEIFVPIDHPAGDEFQIDWGQVTINLNSQDTKVMILCAITAP